MQFGAEEFSGTSSEEANGAHMRCYVQNVRDPDVIPAQAGIQRGVRGLHRRQEILHFVQNDTP